MTPKQKTIQKEISISGVGLHTGCKVNLRLKPAAENTGICFVRTDLPQKSVIPADPENVNLDHALPRCTSLGRGEAVVNTVEHFMSALFGLGIHNLTVEIDAQELPGLDGSAVGFLKALKEAGVAEQEQPCDTFKIIEPVGVEQDGSSIYVVPSDELRISYILHYDHPHLQSQYFDSRVDPDIYEREIAPCRTFCLEKEAMELRKTGLGQGANYENTLVVGKDGVINNQLRFENECARHKVLDFIGDLYLLGVPICGHVYATKSGHTLNLQLLKRIWQQKLRYEAKPAGDKSKLAGKKEIDIKGIMKILPHRYPFLFVDRVIEIEQGKRAVGIKNLTINDYFFKGHFPTRPVMPGVLMIEAMAQTAGVVVLTNAAHRGKLAFFMSADNIKFRKVVTAGDQLYMEVDVLKDKNRTSLVHGVAKVNGEIVAQADMLFSFTDDSYLNVP